MIRSIIAIVVGFLIVVVLSIATDAVMHAVGIIPDGPLYATAPLLLALAYRTVYTIFGCYITARLAPRRPMKHAMIIGCIGLVIGSLGAYALRELGAGWYAWSVALESIPCAYVGGLLRLKQLHG